MKIPQWLAWPCAIITALLALAIIVLIILNPVPTFGGGYSCETRLSIAYKGMTAATAEVDRKGMAAFALTRSMTDAFGPCEWQGRNYVCQNVP